MRIKLDKEKVTDLYNSGMSQVQIGEALGVSVNTIAKFMKKHDIKTGEMARRRKKLSNSKKELIQIVDSVNIGYRPIHFEKKRTQVSDELNLYIPEKWNRNENGR